MSERAFILSLKYSGDLTCFWVPKGAEFKQLLGRRDVPEVGTFLDTVWHNVNEPADVEPHATELDFTSADYTRLADKYILSVGVGDPSRSEMENPIYLGNIADDYPANFSEAFPAWIAKVGTEPIYIDPDGALDQVNVIGGVMPNQIYLIPEEPEDPPEDPPLG